MEIKMNAKRVLLAAIAALAIGTSATAVAKDEAGKPLAIEKREGIRVVYQIKTDEWKGNVGSGLHYVEKLVKAYRTMGLADDAFQVHAVLHSDAGYWLLEDGPYRKTTGKDAENPNKEIVRSLVERGVKIEICAQTMKDNGWTFSDLLSGVTPVIGAYPRIIDLQQRGYAYIRF